MTDPAAAPTGTRVRLLRGPAGGVARQMAVDAALLFAEPSEPCTLRLYCFTPPGLSLGWFQTLADVPGTRADIPVARRLTGGGAIHHGREVTFSLCAPAHHPIYRGPVADSYRRVHHSIAAALARLGIEARLREGSSLASDRTGTGMCFHDSSPLDLVWAANGGALLAKGVGSAQRRRGGRVLHHGSIKLCADPLEPGVATVGEALVLAGGAGLDEPLLREAVERALLDSFRRDLGLCFEPGELGAAEWERVDAFEALLGDRERLAERERGARGGLPSEASNGQARSWLPRQDSNLE